MNIPNNLKNTAAGIVGSGMKNLPGAGQAPQILSSLINTKAQVPDYKPLMAQLASNASKLNDYRPSYVDSEKMSRGYAGPPSPDMLGGLVTKKAASYEGTPYIWGGTTPKGFDCSGLTQYVYKQFGVKIPRTAQQQFKSGTPVSHEQLQPGDLVFFNGYKGKNGIGHVGIYSGGGEFFEAPKKGTTARFSKLASRKDFVGARRYLQG